MSSSSCSSSSSSSSSSDSGSESESEESVCNQGCKPYVTNIFNESMQLRERARDHGHESLSDVYLMIAAADMYNTLKPNYLQLCNLLFLNMLLIKARSTYKSISDAKKRKKHKQNYLQLKKREEQMRDLIRKKL